MVDSSLVTFLPSSKSRDTKTRPNIKNASRSKLDLPYFKNQWSVASSHCNWQRRQRLKIEGFPTLKGSWPWPILGHTAHCRASLIHLYLHAKFHWNQRSFFVDRRMYVWTGRQKFETGFIRSTLKSPPENCALLQTGFSILQLTILQEGLQMTCE